jgi:TonB family protein
MQISRYILVSVLFLAIFPLVAHSQGPMPPPATPAEFPRAYQNSSDGLRWQLQDILNAARDPNRSRLDSLIRQMEIPNSKEWFTKVFGREMGANWGGAYESNLGEMEKNFQVVLEQLAGEDGEFWTRVVNDGPAPARKIEASMVGALQRPINIYFASWKERGSPPDSQPTAIGYFMFLDGSFRLDSAVSPIELQPQSRTGDTVPQTAAAPAAGGPSNHSANGIADGVYRSGAGGVGYPSCDRCPDPKYTKLARKKKLEGTVVLQVIIQPNGGITDIQLVKSPAQELTDMAIEAVKNWHMNPAHRADGVPVPVMVPVEVTFRLLK